MKPWADPPGCWGGVVSFFAELFSHRTKQMKRNLATIGWFLLLLSGCGGAPPSNREVGALTGAAVGAGGGALVGQQAGNTAAGAAIGAAAGALAGGMVGDTVDERDDRIKQQEEIMRRQGLEMERQRREIEDLKRQRFHLDSLQRFEKTQPAEEPQGPPLDQ